MIVTALMIAALVYQKVTNRLFGSKPTNLPIIPEEDDDLSRERLTGNQITADVSDDEVDLSRA